MKKTSKRITGIALSAMMLVSALPVSNIVSGKNGTSFIAGITAEAATDYSTAYHYRTINGQVYIYASGLIYKITKKATAQTSGTLVIAGVHSSAKNSNYRLKAPSYIKYESRRYDITAVGNIRDYADNIINDSTQYKKLKSLDLTNCSKLTEILGSAFWYNENIESISLPSSIQTIGNSAFGYCTSLSSLSIPSAKRIDSGAFQGIRLSSITLPPNLSFIGSNAFANSRVTTVTFQNTNAGSFTTEGSIFGGVNDVTTINIPNEKIFRKLIETHALQGASGMTNINGKKNQSYQPILTYEETGIESVRKPVFDQYYFNELKTVFEIADYDRLAFYEEYFAAERKYIAKTVTANCNSTVEKVRALHDWVCDKVDYAYINGEEDHSLYCYVDSSAFMRDTTICYGYARALVFLLREAGIEAYGVKSNLGDDSHAWVMVKIGNNYYHVDPTHDDGEEVYTHFLKSDADIKKCNAGHDNWTLYDFNHVRGGSRFKALYGDVPETVPACNKSIRFN